ncbi:MAG: DUF1826 domain-containing protein [Pseudomonadota bacterium]
MNFEHATRNDAAFGVAFADRPEELVRFLRPGCAATIWRRKPDRDFQAWINNLPPDQLPTGRAVLRYDAVFEMVQGLCDIAGTPHCSNRDMLVEDMSQLAQVFSQLLDVRYLRLRLGKVTTNACRKFHIDAIEARLLCTYRGPGTQYGISTDGNDPKRVFAAPTGAPILMRGRDWPDKQPSSLVHRSPPIEGSHQTRLVLVLDPVSDPGDEI